MREFKHKSSVLHSYFIFETFESFDTFLTHVIPKFSKIFGSVVTFLAEIITKKNFLFDLITDQH